MENVRAPRFFFINISLAGIIEGHNHAHVISILTNDAAEVSSNEGQ